MFLTWNASNTNEVLAYAGGIFVDLLPLIVLFIGLEIGFFIYDKFTAKK
jgi:hypothetical protein